MGFDISKVPKHKRHFFSTAELEKTARCLSCKIRPICGGWRPEDDARWCTGQCDHCRAVCCDRPDKDKVLEGLGTLRLTERWAPWSFAESPQDWPPFIWQLNGTAYNLYQPIYTIALKHIFYWRYQSWGRERDLKARFNIPAESKLCLNFATKDRVLDMWLENIEAVYDKIAWYQGVDFVFAINFSMYDNYPPLDRLVNLKRCFQSLEKLQQRGVNVVPDVGWVRLIDVDRCADWVRGNNVPVVSLNMQTVRRMNEKQLEREVKLLERFFDRVGYPVRMVFFGASGPKRMRRLLEVCQNATFVDAQAYRYAEFHRHCYGDRGWSHGNTIPDLFVDNAEYLQSAYDTIIEEKGERYGDAAKLHAVAQAQAG